MNANDRIRDLAIRHGVYLDRYTRRQAQEMVAAMRAAVAELEVKLRNTLYVVDRKRVNDVLVAVRSIIKGATDRIQPQFFRDMEELASYESGIAGRDLRASVGISTVMPAPEQVLSAINVLPAADGFLMTDLYNKWSQGTIDAFVTQIRLGIFEGDTVDDLVTRMIRGPFELTTRGAEALARTAVAHVNNTARELVYEANDDIIKGYQYVATLDSETCLSCGPLDGKIYGKDENRPMLPAHYNCRCLYTPVTKSYRELGLDIDELSPGTRSSLDGRISETTTYTQWLRSQDKDVIKDILGPGRAELFNTGTPLVDFTDRRGNVVTLEELRGLDNK